MIDLILVSCIGAAFFAGFKAGNRFKTISEMVNAGLDKMKR